MGAAAALLLGGSDRDRESREGPQLEPPVAGLLLLPGASDDAGALRGAPQPDVAVPEAADGQAGDGGSVLLLLRDLPDVPLPRCWSMLSLAHVGRSRAPACMHCMHSTTRLNDQT